MRCSVESSGAGWSPVSHPKSMDSAQSLLGINQVGDSSRIIDQVTCGMPSLSYHLECHTKEVYVRSSVAGHRPLVAGHRETPSDLADGSDYLVQACYPEGPGLLDGEETLPTTTKAAWAWLSRLVLAPVEQLVVVEPQRRVAARSHASPAPRAPADAARLGRHLRSTRLRVISPFAHNRSATLLVVKTSFVERLRTECAEADAVFAWIGSCERLEAARELCLLVALEGQPCRDGFHSCWCWRTSRGRA
jgi:hypothetical protein